MMLRTRSPYFRLVDDLLNDARPWPGSLAAFENRGKDLALDVEETPDAYIVSANLPGISLDDVSVSIHEDVLTITAETGAEQRDENSRMLMRERRYGKFSRSLRFPTIVDGNAVDASFENGVLSVRLPKADHVKPRQIPVNVAGNGS